MSKEKRVFSEDWIKEKRSFLKEKLPSNFCNKLFLPDNDFYSSYRDNCRKDPQQAIDSMANNIFSFLNIERSGCIVGFYNPSEIESSGSPDSAGFYTKVINEDKKEIEVIMINSDYYTASMGVAAILAHEIMHLFLFRLGIELEDTLENEVLTDLATIETGLGMLTINAMSSYNHIFLTLVLASIGFLYWSSGETGYGYLRPREYANYFNMYLKELDISVKQIGGHIAPLSRSLVKLSSFKKYSDSTPYIEYLRKDHIKLATKKLVFLLIILGIYLYLRK